MNVLFYKRADANQRPGGDLVQMEQTAHALEAKGVRITWSSDPRIDLTTYDIIHIFNSPRFDETYTFIQNAKHYDKPIAFSTIYWPKNHLAMATSTSRLVVLLRRFTGETVTFYIWSILKALSSLVPDTKENLERRIMRESDILLPNSDGEMREIKKFFFLFSKPFVSVRNAVQPYTPTIREKDIDVLSVGRIEPRKNTLALIEAVKRANRSLVLIGALGDDEQYNTSCLDLIKRYSFQHHEHMPHDEILTYMERTVTYAQVSWYETPGLASLEALSAGCNLVTTEFGSTREYFKEKAIYCNPHSLESITGALAIPPTNENYSEWVNHNFTWALAADDTLKAYAKLQPKDATK